MDNVVRIGVSLPPALLESFDEVIKKKGYSNRSEAIRDAIRDYIVGYEWETDQECIGVITIVYNHHESHASEHLTEAQHHYFHRVRSALHVHLDADNCLEVVIVEGDPEEIEGIVNFMQSIRGVKHCKLTATTKGDIK